MRLVELVDLLHALVLRRLTRRRWLKMRDFVLRPSAGHAGQSPGLIVESGRMRGPLIYKPPGLIDLSICAGWKMSK